MEKEQQAVELYRALGESAINAKVKNIFENLTNMERGHKHILKNVFVEIGCPKAF